MSNRRRNPGPLWLDANGQAVISFKGIASVLAVLVLIAWLSGCAGLDPLGSIEPNPQTGEASLAARAGIICRELSGKVGTRGIDGFGAGFRCLDVGAGPIDGCVEYDDGRFSYQSAGCGLPPTLAGELEALRQALEDQGAAAKADHNEILLELGK